jgi:hypothetical protein
VATAKRYSALAATNAFSFPLPMKRLVAFAAFFFTLSSLHAATPLLTLNNEQIPSPAGVGAQNPQLVVAGGRVVLSWIQPGADNTPVLHFARLDPQKRAWSDPSVVGPATSNLDSAPVAAGPVTVSKAGRIATVWFVSDKNDPRVLMSVSSDAGTSFLMPLRIEDTRPVGAADLVLLADGTVFVSWLERYNKTETAIWLRRISPGGNLSVPVLLATLSSEHVVPRLALVKDYDATPAQLLLAYAVGEADASQVITRLLTIPLPNNAAADPCNCPTGDEAARGYALKGRIVSIVAAHNALVVQHDEIDGVLPAAATEFRTDLPTLKLVTTGNEIFGRIERRGDDWWLFAVRLIVRPQTSSTHHP